MLSWSKKKEFYWLDFFSTKNRFVAFNEGSEKSNESMNAGMHIFFMVNIIRKTPKLTIQAAIREDPENTNFASKLLFPYHKKIGSGQNSTCLQHFLSLRNIAWYYATEAVTFTLRHKTTLIKKRRYEYLRDRTTSSLSLRNWHAYNGNLLWICTHLVLNEKIVCKLFEWGKESENIMRAVGISYGSSAIINDKTDSEISISLIFSSSCQYRIDAANHPLL